MTRGQETESEDGDRVEMETLCQPRDVVLRGMPHLPS